MTNPLRQALQENAFGDSRLDQLARGSLLAGEQKFFTPAKSLLSVEIEGGKVDASAVAKVSLAVIDSAAHFAKSVSDRTGRDVRVTRSFRERLGFENLGMVGNRIYLGFPGPVKDDQDALMSSTETPSVAEVATKAFAQSLPESPEDDAALDAALGLLTPERVGLRNLSEVLDELSRTIEVSLKVRDGSEFIGQMTSEQARTLKSSLSESRNEEDTSTYRGVLDGMRTRRRQFFLDSKSGESIAGTVADELLTTLPKFIGQSVIATVVKSTVRRADGRSGRPGYRLINIAPDLDPNH